MKVVAEALGVSRSNLHDRLRHDQLRPGAKPRRRYHKAQDAAVLPLLRGLVDQRPTYGYRRITALLNRARALQGAPPVNHKRVYRIMRDHALLLEKHTAQRPGRIHDGKVVVMRSNLRSPLSLGPMARQWLTARTGSNTPAGTARSCARLS